MVCLSNGSKVFSHFLTGSSPLYNLKKTTLSLVRKTITFIVPNSVRSGSGHDELKALHYLGMCLWKRFV